MTKHAVRILNLLPSSAEQGVHCARASSDEHHAAHEVGMGMGKYQVWKELANAGVDISQEEAANMTMAELRDLAAQNGIDLYGAGSTLSDSSTSQHRLSSKHNEYQHHGDSNE